jgi:hypothetical protein
MIDVIYHIILAAVTVLLFVSINEVHACVSLMKKETHVK